MKNQKIKTTMLKTQLITMTFVLLGILGLACAEKKKEDNSGLSALLLLAGGGTLTGTSTAPSGLTYSGSPFIFVKDTAITTQTPTVTGTLTSCTASPTLPTGLSISSTTCAISGTPTTAQSASSYTITASNSAGNTTASISITVASGNLMLSLSHSSATSGSKFGVLFFNSSGQKVAGLSSTTTLSGTSYSGLLKTIDSAGALTSTDANVSNGTYAIAIYSDSDNSSTVTTAGDKVYAGSVTVSGYTTITITNSMMVTPVDMDIQYSGGALGAYNGKPVYCYLFGPGIASTITSASTFTTAKTHGLSVGASTIASGSFSGASNATVAKYFTAIGHQNWFYNSYIYSGATADVACFVDNDLNGNPTAGEPYLKATSGTTGSTITVTSSGTL